MRIRSALFGGTDISGMLANAAYFLMRCVAGLTLAFNHGIGKLPPSERFVEGIKNMGFPLPEVFAFAAGISEFVGGLLLAIGLLTRPSSFFILTTMLVAVFIRHAQDPFGGSKELATIYACLMVMFTVTGSGKFGLDAIVRKGR